MVTSNKRIARELKELGKEFLAIRSQVDEVTIAKAVIKTGDSRSTYFRYLSGDVKKLVAGKRMLDCLKGLIKSAQVV